MRGKCDSTLFLPTVLHRGTVRYMVPCMRSIILTAVLLVGAFLRTLGAPPPAAVVILYNSSVADSKALAGFYSKARGIPSENLIGLSMPTDATISREDYEALIARPLREEFDKRKWWVRAKERASGLIMPVASRMQVMVVMRGVPLRVQAQPKPAGQALSKNPFTGRDEAAVDSELAMLGIEGGNLDGPIPNKYFKSDEKFSDSKLPFLILTARIDATSLETCERMIRDAVETEVSGLWGMAYVDIANKLPQGDQWLEEIAKANQKAGIATVVDRFNETLPRFYPMENAALYFGWYAGNANGPLLNPVFRFRKGAIATHIHSFSAEQLHQTKRNWAAPLLECGAAATVGNVYEPYLHLTHDLGLLYQRLLAGHSWVEACWMAMPVVSWQGVVLGDPLYQPFLHLAGTGVVRNEDRTFRALRAAKLRWPDSDKERTRQLDTASENLKSGELCEAVGLELLALGRPSDAAERFSRAKQRYARIEDQMRQDFHLIAIERTTGRKDQALTALREGLSRYGETPGTKAFSEWIEILAPSEKTPAAKGADADKPANPAP